MQFFAAFAALCIPMLASADHFTLNFHRYSEEACVPDSRLEAADKQFQIDSGHKCYTWPDGKAFRSIGIGYAPQVEAWDNLARWGHCTLYVYEEPNCPGKPSYQLPEVNTAEAVGYVGEKKVEAGKCYHHIGEARSLNIKCKGRHY